MIETQKISDTLLADLNPQQREAAAHGHSPLLIIAGAGTGKTTTLAHRVAHLIATGIDPQRILLLTFTRRASAEMLRRVDSILRRLEQLHAEAGLRTMPLNSRRIWGGTFHSVATRLLRQHGKRIGLQPEFTILDRSDAEDLLNVIRNELELAKTETRFPLKGTCMDIYSRCVNSQQKLASVLNSAFPWCLEHEENLKTLFEKFVDRKEAQASLDYDDLLLFWKALVEEPECAQVLRDKFDCVLVDEYQDTNVLQAAILKNLCPDGEGLTVVGDDAQSIYSFRAATVRNILDFPRDFPGTTLITLEENYRSSQPILDATNRVIAHAVERHKKDLWSSRVEGIRPKVVQCLDEDEQTDYLVETILAHRETGTRLQQQAVLFRASHHSLALEVELSRRNIPFHKYGGLKFIETAHVKDLLAFLRLAENPRDTVAGTRILTLIPGIGPKKAGQLMNELAQSRGDFSVWRDFKIPAAATDHWPLFVALMRSLGNPTRTTKEIAGEVHQVRRFYTPLLEQKYDHAKPRLRDLEQLELVAARFPDRMTFLTEITLDPPSSTQDMPADPHLDEDFLILSTMHSAKGLEWEAVYVIHAADGNIPSDMATSRPDEIEEERRLFYVACTRAKNWLYVCHPQRYYFHAKSHSDAHSYAQLTRFLPADVLECCEQIPAGLIDADENDDVQGSIDTKDVRNRLKKMWG